MSDSLKSITFALCFAACAGAEGPPGAMGRDGAIGPMGLQGAKGATGPQGPDGAPGPGGDYRPKFWVACSTSLDLISGASGIPAPGKDGITETLLVYNLTIYTTKDVDVSCTAAAGSAQEGSGSAFYPEAVTGAAAGGCIASVDLPPYPPSPNNAGNWLFDIGPTGPRATYKDDDAGHPLNAYAHAFTEDECNSLLLNPNLTWGEVTLAAVFAH